jgi:hypothetical protein
MPEFSVPIVPSTITPAAMQAPVRSPLKRSSSAVRTSSLLKAKAGVVQNVTAERTRRYALMICHNPSSETTAQPGGGIAYRSAGRMPL